MKRVAARYGIELPEWENAREEMRRVLITQAQEGQPTSYSELVNRVRTIRLEPESYALAAMLGEISEEEDALGRGMLTVLVVHKHGDPMPGQGFFDLAKKLGRDVSDRERCWIEESRRVLDVWSRNRPPRP